MIFDISNITLIEEEVITENIYSLIYKAEDDYLYYQGEVSKYNDEIKWDGYGKLWKRQLSYHGNFKDGIPSGLGILNYTCSNDDFKDYSVEFVKYFEGNLEKGKKQGIGKEIYLNNESYEGSFKNSLRNGLGIYFGSNGSEKIKGMWVNGSAVDTKEITEFWDNGNIKYKGGFDGKSWTGKGVVCYPNGNICFEGEFLNNKVLKGTIKNYLNIKIIEGTFSKNGNKIFYYNNGEKLLEYTFEENKNSKDKLISNKHKIKKYTLDSIVEFEGDIFEWDLMHFEDIIKDNVLKQGEDVINEIQKGGIPYKKGNWYFTDTNINTQKIKYIMEYTKSGLIHNEYKEFYRNGILHIHSLYNKGSEEGMYKEYYDNGRPYIQTQKTKSKFIGQYKEFSNNPHSSLIKLGEYVQENNKVFLKNAEIFNNVNKRIYEGDLDQQNRYSGPGKLYFNNDTNSIQYEGEFKNGKFHNTGTIYFLNENLSYQGGFCNGKRHGTGTSYYESTGTVEYIGDWVYDEKHGNGILFSETNEQVWEGAFNYDDIQIDVQEN